MRKFLWTEAETDILRKMKEGGRSYVEIGKRLGRRPSVVSDRWRWISMTPDKMTERRDRINARRNGGVPSTRVSWTEEQKRVLMEMRDVQKASWADISKAIGKPSGTVYSKYYYIKNLYMERRDASDKPDIPKRNVDEWRARQTLSPRDLTSALMGDPLPGYSALERRA